MKKQFYKKIRIFLFAVLAVFGTVSLTQSIQPTVIYADEMGTYPTPGERPPAGSEEEEESPFDYDEDGLLEKLVVGLYDVTLTIFGTDINFGDLANTLQPFINFEQSKRLQLDANQVNSNGQTETRSFNLYKVMKEEVYPAVKGMGVSLLTMMMMWKFVKECMEVERFSWERAMMLIAKTIMVDMFINYSFEILELFFGWVMDALDLIITINPSTTQITNIGEMFATAISHEDNPFHKVIVVIPAIIFAFVYYGTCITVISQVIVRYMKILIGMAFAPLPIAVSVDEQHGTDVMRYIFWMTGAFLQAPIIKVCLYIYSLLLADLGNQLATMTNFNPGTLIPVCLMTSIITGLLALSINMAQQVTDRIMPA